MGKFWAEPDDFTLICPLDDGMFTVSQPLKNQQTVQGGFADTLLQTRNLTSDNMFTTDVYSTYTGGNYGLQVIRNENLISQGNTAKILVIRDSYGQVVTPFLALECGEIHAIDLRWEQRIESVQHYISEINPDAVIVLYTVDTINNDAAYIWDSSKS